MGLPEAMRLSTWNGCDARGEPTWSSIIPRQTMMPSWEEQPETRRIWMASSSGGSYEYFDHARALDPNLFQAKAPSTLDGCERETGQLPQRLPIRWMTARATIVRPKVSGNENELLDVNIHIYFKSRYYGTRYDVVRTSNEQNDMRLAIYHWP